VHTVSDTPTGQSQRVFPALCVGNIPKVDALVRQEQATGLAVGAKALLETAAIPQAPNGLNIWKPVKSGPEKSRRLHGYLLENGSFWYSQKYRPNNPLSCSDSGRRRDSGSDRHPVWRRSMPAKLATFGGTKLLARANSACKERSGSAGQTFGPPAEGTRTTDAAAGSARRWPYVDHPSGLGHRTHVVPICNYGITASTGAGKLHQQPVASDACSRWSARPSTYRLPAALLPLKLGRQP